MKLKIFSPEQGMGKKHKASAVVIDGSNYIDLGLIIYDDNGKELNDLEVEITTPDKEQNRILKGTGFVRYMWKDEKRVPIPYYQFHYEFKKSGKHLIKFSAKDNKETFAVNTLMESVLLDVE